MKHSEVQRHLQYLIQIFPSGMEQKLLQALFFWLPAVLAQELVLPTLAWLPGSTGTPGLKGSSPWHQRRLGRGCVTTEQQQQCWPRLEGEDRFL